MQADLLADWSACIAKAKLACRPALRSRLLGVAAQRRPVCAAAGKQTRGGLQGRSLRARPNATSRKMGLKLHSSTQLPRCALQLPSTHSMTFQDSLRLSFGLSALLLCNSYFYCCACIYAGPWSSCVLHQQPSSRLHREGTLWHTATCSTGQACFAIWSLPLELGALQQHANRPCLNFVPAVYLFWHCR